jgi:hypothetical protein
MALRGTAADGGDGTVVRHWHPCLYASQSLHPQLAHTVLCVDTPLPYGVFPPSPAPLQERAVIGITRSPEVLGVDSALLAAKAEFYQRELGLGRGELGALYVREPTTLLASLDRLQATAAWLRCTGPCCCSPRRFAPHPCCLPRLLSRLLLMADALFLPLLPAAAGCAVSAGLSWGWMASCCARLCPREGSQSTRCTLCRWG